MIPVMTTILTTTVRISEFCYCPFNVNHNKIFHLKKKKNIFLKKQTPPLFCVVDEPDEMAKLPMMFLGTLTLILVMVIVVLAYKARRQRGKTL